MNVDVAASGVGVRISWRFRDSSCGDGAPCHWMAGTPSSQPGRCAKERNRPQRCVGWLTSGADTSAAGQLTCGASRIGFIEEITSGLTGCAHRTCLCRCRQHHCAGSGTRGGRTQPHLGMQLGAALRSAPTHTSNSSPKPLAAELGQCARRSHRATRSADQSRDGDSARHRAMPTIQSLQFAKMALGSTRQRRSKRLPFFE